MRGRFLILCLAALPAAAQAVEFRALAVSRDADRYQVKADVYLAAPPQAVYAVLTDYAHFARISPSIVSSRVVQPLEEGGAVVYTDSRICALFICRHIQETQKFIRTAPLGLTATVLPEQSNLKSGDSSWQVEAEGEGTRMRMELTLEPAFWVPPLIGPALVVGSLKAEGRRAAAGVERLARQRAQLPPITAESHGKTY
jgi:hypothetical protein